MLGPTFGLSVIVWMIAIVAVAWMVWHGRSNYVGGTLIVLTKFRIDEDPSAATCLEIRGRASGIVSWALTLLKLSPEVKLVVNGTDVTICRASLGGIEQICVPLKAVGATVCGYQRSLLALGFAILFGVGFALNLLSALFGGRGDIGDVGVVFGYMVLAGGAGFVYYVSKRIAIAIESHHFYGVAFKSSLIENVSVDLGEAMRAISVVNARILRAQEA